MKVRWFGHSSFRVRVGGKTIYFDPFGIPEGSDKADFILTSHEHYDHCSLVDIDRITKEDTVFIAPESAAEKIQGEVMTMSEGDILVFNEIKVEAVPAYNLEKSFHPRGLGLGFILEAEDKRLYHAGDTDHIPELERLWNITMALLPVSGTYTMTAEQAAQAAEMLKPDVAIPMHWGLGVAGSRSDAERFKKLLDEKGIRTEILGDKEFEI